MKAQNYTQVTMILKYPPPTRGFRVDTVWVPSQFAKKGKILKIKQEDGTWENGWEVTAVWDTMKAEEVEENERDYLHQRKASDI